MVAVRITLNGEVRSVQSRLRLDDLVAELKLKDRPIAVERNREVVPKNRFCEICLQEGDVIEIVHFVGGG